MSIRAHLNVKDITGAPQGKDLNSIFKEEKQPVHTCDRQHLLWKLSAPYFVLEVAKKTEKSFFI